MEVPPDMEGQVVQCPACGIQLQAPGTPSGSGAMGKILGWTFSGLFSLALIAGLGFAAWHFGLKNKIFPATNKKGAHKFSAPIAEEIGGGGKEKGPAVFRIPIKKVRPSDLILDFPAGVVGGIGVGSDISSLKGLHGGLKYVQRGSAFYCREAGLRLEVTSNLIYKITVAIAPHLLDGQHLDQFPGRLVPDLGVQVGRESAARLLGKPTLQDASSLVYRTLRRDAIRLSFGKKGTLQRITFEAGQDFFKYQKLARQTPVRHPDSKPYQLPDGGGKRANFDLGRQVGVGMPLGEHYSHIAGLPDDMIVEEAEGLAYFAPAGLVVQVEEKRIIKIEVFVRPEFQDIPLKPYKGTFTHGIHSKVKLKEVRDLLGPENGYGEDARMPSLYYIMENSYYRFSFTPGSEELISVTMGLVNEVAEMPVKESLDSLKAIVQKGPIWRNQKVVAFTDAGQELEAASETKSFYSVNTGDVTGWIAKTDARKSSESAIWLEVAHKVRFRESDNPGKLIDASFIGGPNLIAAAGEFAGIKRGSPDGGIHMYKKGVRVPFKTYKGRPVTNVVPMPESGEFLSIANGKKILTFCVYNQTKNQPLSVRQFDHEEQRSAEIFRVCEQGHTAAVVWKQKVSLVALPDADHIKSLDTQDTIQDVALSSDGKTLWILHSRSVIIWNATTGKTQTVGLAGRRHLYRVPGHNTVLALSKSRQRNIPFVSAFDLRSARPLWQSNDFLVIPPSIGGASLDADVLVGASTLGSLAAVLVDPRTGTVKESVSLGDEHRISQLRGLKISPDAVELLAWFSDGTMKRVEVESRSAETYRGFIRSFHPSSSVRGGAISVVAEGAKVFVYVGKAKVPEMVLEASAPVTALEISAKKTWIAAGDSKGIIYVWNATNGNLLKTFKDDQSKLPAISKIRITSDDQAILYSAKGHLSVVMNYLVPPYSRFEFSQGDVVSDFELSPDGLKCISLATGEATRLYAWNLEDRKREQGIGMGQPAKNGTLAFAPEMIFAFLNLDGKLFKWQLPKKGKGRVSPYELPKPYTAGPGLIAPDGRHLFRFEKEGVRIWDIVAEEPIAYSATMRRDGRWTFSSDARTLTLALDGELEVLSLMREK